MRLLATFSGSFAFGIFLLQYWLPVSWALPGALVCTACGWLSLLLPKKWRRRPILICLGLSLALGWNWLYIRQVQQPLLALAGTEQSVELTVCDYPTPTTYGARVPVKLNSFSHGKAVFYGDSDLLELVPGQSIQTSAQIESASRIKDEDVTTFTSKGIYLLCYNRGSVVLGPGTMNHPRWWPARIGHAMQQRIQDLFQGDIAAFLTAILTGNRLLLSEEASAHLAEAGLLHILAVSGLHCGFLLTMVTLLAGRHRRRLVALLSIPLLVFYAILTGGSPSVLRACTMLSLFVLAPLVDRDSDGLTSLSVALFLILLQNPFAAASVSLQLSFGAMLGILLVTRPLYSMLIGAKKHGKCFCFIASGVSATIGALVCTVPLSAFYFNTLVLISPISNLLCLWAASLVFILGLLAVLTSFLFPPLAGLIGWVPTLLIRYILSAAQLLCAVPFHAVYFSNPYLKVWLIFLYLLFGTACVLAPGRRRPFALAAGIGAITLVLTTWLGISRYDGDLDVIAMDIGQGQCVILASDRTYALLDCGSIQEHNHSGEIAAQQLRSMGCDALDYLLLTHYDFDHVSGVRSLMARLPVKTLLIPDTEDDSGLRNQVLEIASAYDTEIQTVTSLREIPFGRASLTIYPPVGTEGDNELGLTCLASTGNQDFLVTGDMSVKTSTGDALLDQLKPEIVCISAGKNNRFHHPSDLTLRRLAEHGCAIYRTDLQGHIHLSFSQGDHHGIQEKSPRQQ